MKTRIYATPAVKGLKQHWVEASCLLYGSRVVLSEAMD